ncbi:hypothetical protein Oweho_0763 [Owenweeksia hongkongensis DSM 17368]|uniref:Aminopeptidase N n=1 Tax=Owenweeksia hongkongensis (strain DSM 17368 / CIP 108786 / JCM 12287 / NRRL B-23963 / UST20020801) TaxID=926562 RepID=G8R226_OWEHD|nr:hypothetical protein [Owenweeksia hongkongensis]AEV31776.1 hypothetical protein Oweho_0763 [Owenweeksia hongkongensis DSM 17368]
MYRFLAIGILLLFSLPLLAQPVRYHYNLKFDDSIQTISGNAKVSLHNNTSATLTEIVLHLPPRALENKKSYLQKELVEFQKVDAYFAKPEELGSIKIPTVQFGDQIATICTKCEFAKIPLATPLLPGDSIKLRFDFQIALGSYEFNGNGFDGKVFRIIDWLPSIATFDSTGFHPYPFSFQWDVYPQKASYSVDLSLPDKFLVASNAELSTSSEKERLDYLKAHPYTPHLGGDSLKTLHFEHVGTNLQFFISQYYFVFPIDANRTLYLTSPDRFSPSAIESLDQQVSKFFKGEIDNALDDYDLIILDVKIGEYQSDHLLSLEMPKDAFKQAAELAHARAEMLFRYQLQPNGIDELWLARGVPYFYKYQFINEFYPEEKWLPFSNSFVGRFFALDAFDYSYQNQFLYLYLARQGLDQSISTPADSLSRLNYEAIAEAKTFMALNHLREYISPNTFKRSMKRFVEDSSTSSVPLLKSSFEYFSNKSVDWFFQDWLPTAKSYDYALTKTDYCPTISTATVKNKGALILPFSLTGIKDDEVVLTQWYDGHDSAKTVQMYHADYDKVVLNYHQTVPEMNQKDNTYFNRLLFQRLEPLRLQFYYSFEDPNRSQLFWTPTISYNAYDKLLLGVSLDNSSLVQKPFEYLIGPDFSTGTGTLTGYTSFKYNFVPEQPKLFHQISAGLYTRYYHYDQDLAYFRISPALNFYFKKPYPRSSILQQLKLRLVHLDRELPDNFTEPANEIGNSSFTVFNANYRYQETNILHPYLLQADFQLGDQFSRIGLEADVRWMLPNKKWLIWRSYAGAFFFNKFYEQGITNSYYSIGLSGTKDFLFDLPFFGRSDETGIWSQQFFVSEGGFKSATNVFADQWMLSTNLVVPVWSVFGAYADAGLSDGFNKVYYDAGLRISVITDFFEVYFPMVNQGNFVPTDYNYFSRIRFILDIDQSNIINRLRRGYY